MKNKNIIHHIVKKNALFLITAVAISMAVVAKAEPQQPKLFEPYAPKPSGAAPDGWEIKILEGSQVENSTVLNNKREIKVTVPAYEIVPSPKNGEKIVALKDPGFNPLLANSQKETIGAVLTQYSESSSALQEKLDKVISQLESGIESNAIEPSKDANKKKSNNSSR